MGPLLALPTHRGGWLDPRELVRRLTLWQQLAREYEPAGPVYAPGNAPDWFDLIQAMLRLAPDHRLEALKQAAGLTGAAGNAVRFALGGEAKEKLNASLLAGAARARDPFAPFPPLFIMRKDLRPTIKLPTGLGWEILHRGRASSRGLVLEIVACERGSEAGDPRVPATPQKSVEIGYEYDWWMSEIQAVRCETSTWPANPELAMANGAAGIASRMDSPPSVFSPTAPYLEPLFDQDTPLGEMATLALALGLVSRDPGCRGLAVDAAIGMIEDGRCVGGELGSVYAKLNTVPGAVRLNRVATAMGEIARVSALHRQVAMRTLEGMFVRLRPPIPPDLHHLLGPLHEWLTATGEALAEVAHAPLLTLQGGGKTATLAKALLAMKAQSRGPQREIVYYAALQGRIERIRRWTDRCRGGTGEVQI